MSRRYLAILLGFICINAMAFDIPPTVVETAIVKTDSWQPRVQSTGVLVANQGTSMKSEVAGRVEKINFRSGDYVKAGIILVTLNSDILKAQLALTEAKLKLSQQQYRRKADLLKKKATSQAEVDDALAGLKVSQAQVQQIRAQIQQLRIKAPFSGRLGIRKVDIGDFLGPGSEIVNLQSVTPIFLDFDLPVVYLNKLAKGQKVLLSQQSFPDHQFEATVVAYESKVNQRSQSLKVRAEIDNSDGELTPGTYMHASLLIGQPQQFVMIPQAAVQYSSEGAYVYRFDKGKAVKTPVKTGKQTNQKIIVMEGLKVGDNIITAGGMKLFPGAPVMDVKAAKQMQKG